MRVTLKKNIFFGALFSLVITVGTIAPASSHSGGLDSQGGHNCRVGSCAGTYHCHQAWGPACGGRVSGTQGTIKKFKSIVPRCAEDSSETLTRENIAMIQSKLKSRGFSPGSIDGNYGTSTRNALNKFEAKNGLSRSPKNSIETSSIEELGANC